MSCCCNTNPCSCLPRPSVCCIPTTESITYTFENANLVGIGFFDNDTNYLVQFRGAVSNSAALTITLDAGNNVLVFDFDDEALVADIPDATTTQRGILETATNAEALAKAATDKILTPSNLAALGSTTTFAGLVELATDAETIAGVSTTLAVTPAGFAAAASLVGNETFADAVDRGGTSAAYVGQFGGQVDNATAWIASGLGAGSWVQLMGVSKDMIVVNSPTTWTIESDWTIEGDGQVGTITLFEFGVIDFNSVLEVFFTDSVVKFVGSTLDFNSTSRISDAGVLIPANSVLTTSATAGQLNSALINTFISSANTQTGWGIPSSTLARTTFATYAGQVISAAPTQAEVQAIDNALVIVSQRLGALITDLMAIRLPAT
jgi:hypothetical protein